jgi:predicted metalloprotease
MKWDKKDSGNFEDRRGISGGGKALIGGGAIGIIILLLNMFGGETGQTIGNILQQTQGNQTQTETEGTKTRELSEEEKQLGDFAEACFVYNNETWQKIFSENGMQYEEPGMVLFDDGVNTACGSATSAAGPFYCPGDRKVYMDLRFFEELKSRFGAEGGDFAIAYVIAHEMGHHLQTLLGTSSKVRQLQQGKAKQTPINSLFVKNFKPISMQEFGHIITRIC